jgi:hypothetical protein
MDPIVIIDAIVLIVYYFLMIISLPGSIDFQVLSVIYDDWLHVGFNDDVVGLFNSIIVH